MRQLAPTAKKLGSFRYNGILTFTALALIWLAAGVPGKAFAQAQGSLNAVHRDPRIPFDRNGSSYTAVLPFDQRFSLVNAAPAGLLRVTTWYADARWLNNEQCDDLNARKRIVAFIRTEAKVVLRTSSETARDSVVDGLIQKLNALPVEVFDTVSRRRLRQTFDEALSSYPGGDRASFALLAGKLDSRLDSLPVTALRKAQWLRSTDPAPSDSFSLDIHPLSPNRDFRFCVESVEALPTTDSLQLVGIVASGVRKVLRDYFLAHGGAFNIDTSTYRALQQSLREAVLPSADSIVVPATSMLAPSPPIGGVVKAFVEIANAYNNRCFFASLFTAGAATRRPPATPRPDKVNLTMCGEPFPPDANELPLGWAVRALSVDSGLVKLSRATRVVTRMPRPDTARIAAAGAVALALRGLACPPSELSVCGEAETIARGQTTVNNPRLPTEGNANIAQRSSSADLRVWSENLDTTIVRLREIRDLANYVSADESFRDSLKVTLIELDVTRLKIEEARTAALQQRINIRNVMEQLDAMEAAIVRVATGVIGREIKHVGIATTSTASYETRARWYVGQDIGVLYAYRGANTRETAPYLGVSIYLRPVNKRGNLPKLCPLDLRCTAISIGVTTAKIEQKDLYSGVMGGFPLVLGIGTKLGEFLRVSYNQAFVYTNRFDADGTSHRRLDRLNAVSVSLDADIREILGGLASSLFGK